jgi:hypothetical protein
MSQIQEPLREFLPLTISQQNLNEAMETPTGSPMLLKRVLLQKADTENRNRRKYPKPVLEPVLNEYNNTMVKTRRALGELDHRNSQIVMLQNVSHIITEMWWEDNDVYGNIEILDSEEFPAGRIAAGLLRRKIPIGISSRALGSVSESNGVSVVNDDLALTCFDIVSYESTIGSTLNPLNEGFNPITNKFSTFDDILYDIICNSTGKCECKLSKI